MKAHTILWADDDPDDLELFCEVLTEITGAYELKKFYNGSEVLGYLKMLPPQDYPCLIILDINMPVLDGKQTLVALKSLEQFKRIPVVMFSTSSSEVDRSFCAHYGVEMVTKPPRYQTLKEVVQRLLSYCDQ